MVHFSRWKIFLIVAVCVWAVLFAMPNFVSEKTRVTLSESLPSWMPHKAINLGLDLQGGSHLLLSVDVDVVVKEQIEGLFDEVKKDFRKSRIRDKRKGLKSNGFYLDLQDVSQVDEAKKAIRKIDDRVT
ncbi:MAG: protein translocase subunit SecD, partial [Bdellovibrionales bacterium]